MPKSPTKAKAKAGIFKVRKTRETEPQAGDTLEPPEDIKEAIDSFRDAQEQMKHFEGEMTVHKDTVNDYSLKEFSKRVLKGKGKSFKLLGNEHMVTYVVMDTSAGLSEEDVEAFRERWGEKAADELITPDLGSIRFDGKVLEANYEAVVEALQTLPKDVFESLFKTALMKAKPGAVEKAKKFAKNAEDLQELLRHLKIRNYIR